MVNVVGVAVTETHWEYLDGVGGVVLVARENGKPQAVIEFCPRNGFRLTDCRSGDVHMFSSLEEAKEEHERASSRRRI